MHRVTTAALLALSSVVASPALADGTVTVTWHMEAPDMTDVPEFNDSGTVAVPLVTDCGAAYTLTRVHAFDYFLGSSRGRDQNPVHARTSGIAVTLTVDSTKDRALTAVEISAGEGDWSGNMALAMPIYSPEQIQTLGSAITFVVPREGFTFPKYWKSVTLKCGESVHSAT